jgi:hypothetical protein
MNFEPVPHNETDGQHAASFPSPLLAEQLGEAAHFQPAVKQLRVLAAICEEALALSTREMQALSCPQEYSAFEFHQKRKDLLPRLKESLIALRECRRSWLGISPSARALCSDVKPLFQTLEGLLMKVLLLDRENQQALLKRGLLPAQHLPSAASRHPHCVADLYRRHSGN